MIYFKRFTPLQWFGFNAKEFRFNPVEGKSAEEILSWFQNIVDVELTAPNYTLAQKTINLHLIENPTPTLKSILDDLETVQPLTAFALELKNNLLHKAK